MRMTIALLAFLGAAGVATAADKPCAPNDLSAAEKAIDRVVNWQQLYKAWQDYRHCDQGNAGELFTEAILRLVVPWKGIEELAGAMERDADYRAFVVKHLGSPEAKDDRESVNSRAKNNCPKGQDGFCDQIAKAVKPAGDMFAPISVAPPAPATAAAPPVPAAPAAKPK